MADRIEFTEAMKAEYTILIPNMLPIHFSLVKRVFDLHGYRTALLTNDGHDIVEAGLKYVHNDTCYPALLTIGQFIDALNSGQFDVHKTALALTQTGGGCRASNYIHLLRKALEKAGYGFVPVISVNPIGLEKNSGFKLTPEILIQSLCMVLYGDVLMCLKNQVEPYEKEKGACKAAVAEWTEKLIQQFEAHAYAAVLQFGKNCADIAKAFEAIPVMQAVKTRVGIVGEIYVKYSGMANNHLEDFLLAQGCEVNVPGLMGFLANWIDHYIDDIDLYGGSPVKKQLFRTGLGFVHSIEKKMEKAIRENSRLKPPVPYAQTRRALDGLLGYGCKMGEGWLLPAEMAELIESGVNNIVCVQPFGCLPNHIAGKGTIRALREKYPKANIVPIDYDPGATRVNQENRLKLMLSVARENEQEA